MRAITIALAATAISSAAVAQPPPSLADLAREIAIPKSERVTEKPDLRDIDRLAPRSIPMGPPGSVPDHMLVLHGFKVDLGGAPWQVQLLWAKVTQNPGAPDAWQRQHQCGGAAITPRWVLTAAHCFNIRDASGMPDANFDPVVDMRVRGGMIDIRNTGEPMRAIARVVIHPKYQRPVAGSASRPTLHDLALIEVAEPMFITDGEAIAALPLAGDLGERELQGGDSATFTGWGQTSSEQGAKSVDKLQQGRLLLLSRQSCNDEHGSALIQAGMICAFERSFLGEIASICRGDSGGPLVTRINGVRQLAGIASWIEQCGETPSVFTSIRAHRDWIKKVTEQP